MLRSIVVALTGAVAAIAAERSAAQETPPSPPIVIHAGQLLANPGEPPLREQTIVVAGGKIIAVVAGYAEPTRYGANAKLVDLKDRFVLPGSSTCTSILRCRSTPILRRLRPKRGSRS